MKLLLCKNCTDIIKIQQNLPTTCLCGQSRANKVNGIDVAYQGPGIVLNLPDKHLAHLLYEPERRVEMWSLPKDHDFIIKSEGKDCGKRWGKARTRARRGLAAADGDMGAVHRTVRMPEWNK